MRSPVVASSLIALLASCDGADTGDACDVDSSVADYEPVCDGVLVLYPEESRLFLDGRVVAYLPPDVQTETVYGGTSGNVATIILDGLEVGDGRLSTVTFGASLVEAHVHGVFDSGSVVGLVQVRVEEGEEISF